MSVERLNTDVYEFHLKYSRGLGIQIILNNLVENCILFVREGEIQTRSDFRTFPSPMVRILGEEKFGKTRFAMWAGEGPGLEVKVVLNAAATDS